MEHNTTTARGLPFHTQKIYWVGEDGSAYAQSNAVSDPRAGRVLSTDARVTSTGVHITLYWSEGSSPKHRVSRKL